MKRGLACETRLDIWHQQYRVLGVATVIHAHPKVGVDRNGKVFFAGEGPPDYLGAFRVRDRWTSIAFEAKETKKSRLPFSALSLHQAQYLEGFHIAGWVTGVAGMVQGDMFWFPWVDQRDRYWSQVGSFEAGIPIPSEGWFSLLGGA